MCEREARYDVAARTCEVLPGGILNGDTDEYVHNASMCQEHADYVLAVIRVLFTRRP